MIVLRFFRVKLLGFKRIENTRERVLKSLVVDGIIARRFGVLLRKPKRIAKRIDFKLAFPNPRAVVIG